MAHETNEVDEATKFLKAPTSNGENSDLLANADTQCGFGIFKGPRLQRWATEHVYMVIYGIAGCFIAMSFSYLNGTLTTLEKRFKIPTKTTAFITVGNDISTILTSAFLGYYASRGHRPRWTALGLIAVGIFCLLMATPHFIFGPGEDALKLTREYTDHLNITKVDRSLCTDKEESCTEVISVWAPVLLFFVAEFVAGIGLSLYFTLGLAYLDDNSTKSKTPAMLSWSIFLRTLGPAFGYSLSSACLRLYIAPQLEPLITNEDTRWMGAWWLGWIVFTVTMFVSAFVLYMFPKELPSARERRLKAGSVQPEAEAEPADLSLKDMMQAVKRLGKNKVYVFNTMASIFYLFGYLPYWIFMPKYIETQYQRTASTASMATGTFGLAFSAAGVLLSGLVISKYKPSARAIAAWNGIVDLLTVAGIVCYVFIGCDDSDKATSLITSSDSCSAACHCEYVHYAPICSPQNVTFMSACHAGCTNKIKDELGRLIYTDCKCLGGLNATNVVEQQFASDGPCPMDCDRQFVIFVAIMCFLKFLGSSSRSANLLLALRCISAEDKSFALGLGSMIVSVVCFIPSPILFGWILDNTCVVWGKTCSHRGNCWVYDTKSMRYVMNLLSAACIFVGSFWNIGVWYYGKDLQIFETELPQIKSTETEEFDLAEKPSEIKKH